MVHGIYSILVWPVNNVTGNFSTSFCLWLGLTEDTENNFYDLGGKNKCSVSCTELGSGQPA